MALACRQARRVSLATIAGHAHEAERLELEAHLAFCARCSEEHAALSLVRRLREVGADGPSAVDRQSIRRALAAGEARVAPPARHALWPWGALAAGVAAAAIAGLFVLGHPTYRIVSGDVVASSSGGSTQTAAPAGAIAFHSLKGGQIRVGDAIADLAAGGTDVMWSPRERTLTLVEGAVTVDVAHQVGRHFRVRTRRFTVEVVGTQFTVDLSGVRTHRGVVRVVRPDGTLVGRLEAGQQWHEDGHADGHADGHNDGRDDSLARAAKMPPAPGAVVTTTPAPPPGREPAVPAPLPARAVVGPSTHGSPPAGGNDSMADRLTRGRRFLSRGDAIDARRLVLPLFSQSRDLAVEARVLFAESFLVEGRYADAVDAYRIVARDFPRAEQAEASLFAIAQLQGEHGSVSEARAALRTYIGRYPRGRFVREASERLNHLASLH